MPLQLIEGSAQKTTVRVATDRAERSPYFGKDASVVMEPRANRLDKAVFVSVTELAGETCEVVIDIEGATALRDWLDAWLREAGVSATSSTVTVSRFSS